MMSLPMFFYIALALLSVASASGLIAWSETKREERQRHAAELWRGIRLRNGVTEPSPWHPSTAVINVPGLVEVKPHSVQNPPPLHPWELASPASVPGERPQLASTLENPDGNQVPTDSALVNEPDEPTLELTDPPHPAEQARVLRLFNQGLSQTAIIERVWGICRGGSKKYAEARKRYQSYIAGLERKV